MAWTGYELAKNSDGKIINGDPDTTVTGFKVDSRYVEEGDLFVCLPGEKTDGHKFINDALNNGASGCLVSKEIDIDKRYNDPLIIEVEDTLLSLQNIAKKHRQKFGVSVIGITGSVGKTTTKDMVNEVLSTKYRVLKTEGNLNSEIGLPLMLLKLQKEHQVAVLEMGMNDKGEISRLCEIARPNVAVITNVAESHIEKLGSLDNIASAKSELLEGLLPGGTAVLNHDDWRVKNMNKKAPGEVLFYGLTGGDLIASNIGITDQETTAEVKYQGEVYKLQLPLLGKHNVSNSLAAIAVGKIFGLTINAAIKGLEDFSITSMRTQVQHHKGLTIINDAYNANVQSTIAALEILENLSAKRKIAILGDMYELGEYTVKAHMEIGDEVIQREIDCLITVGKLTEETYNKAKDLKPQKTQIYHVKDNNQAVDLLEEIISSGDAILVKGSRGMAMEKIVYALQEI
ncbi:UDP-N-acetylmuramoyl-tripeptide--D-alanyl-D-alanine ligase [Natranaerobius trueperi]|uniref:UDP-N-acetylmuramoyl-tripeptide--D-alanyl-D-alanine ligase n=1 Tax=Natranaerobius trueperi TaxID=759412 RepID=A0A226C156_9FIRM|nr:UDP-N-acetylmuramoyl-tripeptide--D-alanyl-D-alanine ligase [Natranaerobius trueperi]OWZ84127.1 hypothetical protein CDO51_04465 [Natranaerobius trueperi]